MEHVILFIRLLHIAKERRYLYMWICVLEDLLLLLLNKIGNYPKELPVSVLTLINMAYQPKEYLFFYTLVKNIEKINFS